MTDSTQPPVSDEVRDSSAAAREAGTVDSHRDARSATATRSALRTFVHNVMVLSQDGTATLDRAGRFVMCSPRLATMLGQSPELLKGHSFSSFVLKEDVEEWRSALAEALRQEIMTVKVSIRTAGGDWLEVIVGICVLGGLSEAGAFVLVSDAATQRARVQKLQSMLVRLEEQREELEHAVTTDQLTGAYSAGAIEEVLGSELETGPRLGDPVSVLIADIDHFKLVNDTHGHAFGDEVLKEFCERCRKAIRTSDYLIRYGGDEFVIVLPRTDGRGALAVAERIWKSIKDAPFQEQGEATELTASIGVATVTPGQELTPSHVLARADAALYEVKRNGRNSVEVWTSDTPPIEGTRRPDA